MSSKLATLILTELHEITSNLIESGLAINQHFPNIKSNAKDKDVIGLTHLSEIPLISKGDDYQLIYNEQLANNAFNIQLVDGGLVLLLYEIEKEKIINHRLTFFPSPILNDYAKDNLQIYESDLLFQDICYRKKIPFPIRFDFSKKQFVEINHPMSHLTLGDFECCRIPVTSALYPHIFFRFILGNFYKTADQDVLSILPKSKILVKNEETMTLNEKNTLSFLSI